MKGESKMEKIQSVYAKYFIVITEEDGRYLSGKEDSKCLSYWGENPWDGELVDVRYGNTYEELTDYGEHEGLFYYLYSTISGYLVSYWIVDPDSMLEEIQTYDRYVKKHRLKPDRWYGEKAKTGKYVLLAFSARPHARGRYSLNLPHAQAAAYLKNNPWRGLFEDAVYGNTAQDLDYGIFQNGFYQLFDAESGKNIAHGKYNFEDIATHIENYEKDGSVATEVIVMDRTQYNQSINFWCNGFMETFNPDTKAKIIPEELPAPLHRAYKELSLLTRSKAKLYLCSTGKDDNRKYYASLVVEYTEEDAEAFGIDMDTLFCMAKKSAERLAVKPIFSNTQFVMMKNDDWLGYHELNVLFSPYAQKEKVLRAQKLLIQETPVSPVSCKEP